MSAMFDLIALADRVEANIERQRERLQREIQRMADRGDCFSVELTPDDMLDMHGRPILLDAQIALLNARAVLATHTATQTHLTISAPRCATCGSRDHYPRACAE